MKKREVFGVMSARGSGPTLVVFVFEFLFLGAPQPLPPSAAPQPLPPSAAPRPWPSCTGPWVPPKRGRPPPYPRGRRTRKPREVLRAGVHSSLGGEPSPGQGTGQGEGDALAFKCEDHFGGAGRGSASVGGTPLGGYPKNPIFRGSVPDS